jgi:hypothetical protein
MQRRSWDEILTEQEFLETFHLRKEHLASLRERGLPFFAVNSTTRLYVVGSVVEWLEQRLSVRAGRRKQEADDDLS